MDFNPAPDRLVVRLDDGSSESGATGKGEIVAIGTEVAESPKLHYAVGDTVLFGWAKDAAVISLDEDADHVVLSAGDVLTTLSGATGSKVKIADPVTRKAPSTGAPATKLDDYIQQLRRLAE